MKHLSTLRAAVALVIVHHFFTTALHADDFRLLHSFTNTDGNRPFSGVVISNSIIIGTTESGGMQNRGTIYSINTDGSEFKTIHSFSEDSIYNPNSGLTLAGHKLYGTTATSDEQGAVYSMNLDGSELRVLHLLTSNSAYVFPTLIGTTLYGMTQFPTTAFSISIDGTNYSDLYTFRYPFTGTVPYGGFTLADSMLFGTTSQGGSDGGTGTIFSMNFDGSDIKELYSFKDPDGQVPTGTLTLVGSKLYGTTGAGGENGAGTIFSINIDGSEFQTLHTFDFLDTHNGAMPIFDLTLVGSTLYGTTLQGGTYDDGTIFSINTDGSGFQLRHSFDSLTDGERPTGSLVLDGSVLYGTTHTGGVNGYGTLFSISVVPESNALLSVSLLAGVLFIFRILRCRLSFLASVRY